MKYEIYQLKEDTMEQVKLRFMASDQAAQLGGIHRENYRRVYGGEIPSVPEVGRMLLRLFALFNGSNRPVDFSGHSMSVSDIVRLTEDGASSWWYCDPYGWMELNEEEWGQTLCVTTQKRSGARSQSPTRDVGKHLRTTLNE